MTDVTAKVTFGTFICAVICVIISTVKEGETMKKAVIIFAVSFIAAAAAMISAGVSGTVITAVSFGIWLVAGTALIIWYALGRSREDFPVWFRVLFILSFLPAVLCVYAACGDAAQNTGSSFGGTLLYMLIIMTAIPVIPLAVTVQVSFIIRKLMTLRRVKGVQEYEKT